MASDIAKALGDGPVKGRPNRATIANKLRAAIRAGGK
jgi:hypothetical protein